MSSALSLASPARHVRAARSPVAAPDLPLDDARALLDALRAVVRELRLAERGHEMRPALPPAQLHALRELASRPARSLAELAARTHTDPSSASVVVQRLVARKLVARGEADGDRRRTELTITPAGRALAARAPASVAARIAGTLGARQTATLARGLQLLADGLREAQGAEPAPD